MSSVFPRHFLASPDVIGIMNYSSLWSFLQLELFCTIQFSFLVYTKHFHGHQGEISTISPCSLWKWIFNFPLPRSLTFISPTIHFHCVEYVGNNPHSFNVKSKTILCNNIECLCTRTKDMEQNLIFLFFWCWIVSWQLWNTAIEKPALW